MELEEEHGVHGMNKVELMQKIEQAERYLKSFGGNTSSVKIKKYAINQKIIKMKLQLEVDNS